MTSATVRGLTEGVFGAETIELFLHSSDDQFASQARVVSLLPLLAEKFAVEPGVGVHRRALA